MRAKKSLSLIILIFLLFIFPIQFRTLVQSQENGPASSNMEIAADVIRGTVEDGQLLRVLEGNVHASQDSVDLYCARGVYYENEKKMILTKNVRLYRGTDTLTTDKLTYFEEQKLAIAENNVRVYRQNQLLTADYLEYFYDTEDIKAEGNLKIYDDLNRVYIFGEKGEYLPEQKMSFVQNNVHFMRVDSSEIDTLHIFSNKMEYVFDEIKKVIALDSVVILQNNLKANCDSAVFFMDDDLVYLKVNPVAFQSNNELTGDEIKLVLQDLKLKEIHINNNALAISTADSVKNKENRLEGRQIFMFIEGNELKEIRAVSNAKSLYHLKEEDADQGINSASADTIKAFFKKNEVDSIIVIGGSQGTFYPSDYRGEIRLE